MVVFNYTKAKRREKRVYSLFDATISESGIAMGSIKTSAVLLAIFSVFGLLFCYLTGTFWYNPISLANSSAAGWFYLVFIIAPIAIGVTLNTLKIQNYKVIDYLKIYFKPKKPLNQDGKTIKIYSYEIDTFIEKII